MENRKSISHNISHEVRSDLGSIATIVAKIDPKAGLKIAILDRLLGQETLTREKSQELIDSVNILCDEVFKDISKTDYKDYNSDFGYKDIVAPPSCNPSPHVNSVAKKYSFLSKG
jgi:hypothetical protein